MIINSIYLRRLLLLCFVCIVTCSFAQIKDEETVEQVLYDIHTRNFERPIRLISNELSSMEHLPASEFQDTAYIGLTTLLVTAYTQNNQIDEAEQLLTHAIGFFDGDKRKSPLVYQLYYGYGALCLAIENYETAKNYLEVTIDYLRNNDLYNEDYAVILGSIAACHMKTGQLELAYKEIKESISIIEQSSSRYNQANLIQAYEKAGAICNELNMLKESKEYIERAYAMSYGVEEYTSEFINVAQDLATLYLNEEDYSNALTIFHELEKMKLSEIEMCKVYNGIMMASYYLDNEWDCVDYAYKSSSILKAISLQFITSLPIKEQEEKGQSNAMQLKLNQGILDKFQNNKIALRMAYDNSLFLRQILYGYNDFLREASRESQDVQQTIQNIKQLRSTLFVSANKNYTPLSKQLKDNEWVLMNQLQSYNGRFGFNQIPTWKDVKENLRQGEYAVEFLTYIGFMRKKEEKELRYAALVLSPQMDSPQFIDLCSYEDLYEFYFEVLIKQELGWNNLYSKDSYLYKLLWEKLDPLFENATTVYCSPVITIQNFNLAYIVCPDGRYLNEKYDIRTLSSTGNICDREDRIDINSAALFGGINYSNEGAGTKSTFRDIIYEEINDSTRSGFGHLPASEQEVKNINACLSDRNVAIEFYLGNDASESSFCNMDGKSPSLIHVATHAFYLVGFNKYQDYFQKLMPYSYKDESMLLTGLLFSGANNSLREEGLNAQLYDGVLTAEEISLLDLSSTDLVVLSACNSSLGQAFQEGFGGLVKAFKMAGVRHLLVSLWPVSDEATSMIMTAFYKYLITGTEMHAALKKAQQETAVVYPDPYYWASFILLD